MKHEFESESGESCVTAQRWFIAVETSVLAVLLLLGVVSLFDSESGSRDIFSLLLIYLAFGGLYFLGRLSSLACPSKVLLAGLVFISGSVVGNLLLF